MSKCSTRIYKCSMGFRIPAVDQSHCSNQYNYDPPNTRVLISQSWIEYEGYSEMLVCFPLHSWEKCILLLLILYWYHAYLFSFPLMYCILSLNTSLYSQVNLMNIWLHTVKFLGCAHVQRSNDNSIKYHKQTNNLFNKM